MFKGLKVLDHVQISTCTYNYVTQKPVWCPTSDKRLQKPTAVCCLFFRSKEAASTQRVVGQELSSCILCDVARRVKRWLFRHTCARFLVGLLGGVYTYTLMEKTLTNRFASLRFLGVYTYSCQFKNEVRNWLKFIRPCDNHTTFRPCDEKRRCRLRRTTLARKRLRLERWRGWAATKCYSRVQNSVLDRWYVLGIGQNEIQWYTGTLHEGAPNKRRRATKFL